MVQKKKMKLKKSVVVTCKIVGGILVFCCALFLFYSYQINQLVSIGYSKEASKNIFWRWKKDYVLSIGENQTLNAAFESDDYLEDNLDSYAKIKYQDQAHIIRNINALIEKGYSNSNISMILAHGNDEDVSEFAKRDKIQYLEEFYSIDYAKLKNYDRYVDYSNETGEDEETTVLYVNLDMDKEDYIDTTLVSTFSTDMLVNKHFHLDSDFVPENLVEVDEEYTNGEVQRGSKVAVSAFLEMAKAAEGEGLGLVINSSYRSYQNQEELCQTYADLYGDSYVERYVAKPGYSEHQTGLSFDIGSTSSNIFAESEEYTWMLDHAYQYGFILRFPKSGEDITEFRNEPWHYRYVGKKIAKYIHEEGITYEEYYVQFLDQN